MLGYAVRRHVMMMCTGRQAGGEIAEILEKRQFLVANIWKTY